MYTQLTLRSFAAFTRILWEQEFVVVSLGEVEDLALCAVELDIEPFEGDGLFEAQTFVELWIQDESFHHWLISVEPPALLKDILE